MKILIFFLAAALTISAQQNFIKVVVPEADTTKASSPVYRLSASTLPNSRVTVNGKEYKVYSSGVFAGVVDVNVGTNVYKIISENKVGNAEKEFIIIRNDFTLKTTSADSLAIEKILMKPNKNMWLTEGDKLEVRIKGTPNCKAYFLNGNEMREESADASPQGTSGVYVGSYKVKSTDERNELPVNFCLIKNNDTVFAESKGKIAFKNKDFPLVAKTLGDRSELNYGLGENRLGGAKLSFIDKDISLMIDGKVDGMYRVRLNKNQVAWIPDDQVKVEPYGTPLPTALTETITVSGEGNYDVINVGMNGKLPYSSNQNPTERKIYIDIYGATSNTNWITQRPTTKEIKNIYYNQVEENLLRITIELNHKQLWGYSIHYSDNGLQIKIKHQPNVLKLAKLKIVIDAGHGGKGNNGALGSTGLTEKEVNLSTAKHLKKLLEREGAKVLLTRDRDTSIWNSVRLQKVIEEESDLSISIHSNSIGETSDPTATSGTSSYYKHIAVRPLSVAIFKRMLELGLAPYGNVGSFNFTLNSQTEMPNALVELAFLSNPEDEILLMNDKFREKAAMQILKGIKDFLKESSD